MSLPNLPIPTRADLAAMLERLESGNATPADVVRVMQAVDCITQTSNQWREYLRGKCLAAMVELNLHEIKDGPTTYYIARDKRHKAKDNAAVLRALLDHTGGDVDAIGTYLASDAWKPGATKKALGSVSESLFVTIESEHLRVKSTKELE